MFNRRKIKELEQKIKLQDEILTNYRSGKLEAINGGNEPDRKINSDTVQKAKKILTGYAIGTSNEDGYTVFNKESEPIFKTTFISIYYIFY